MQSVIIRDAVLGDAQAVLAVYRHYVERTAITFEYDVPTLEEFAGRMARTLKMYPYLVAEENGEILGYAYAGAFHARAAYGWDAELTIYLSPSAKGRGLGRRLYAALEAALAAMGVVNLYACIGYTDEEDEYLTRNSAQFHAHLGFAQIGRFNKCGYKFGRWYDMIWMEKIIGQHVSPQPPVTPYPALSAGKISR